MNQLIGFAGILLLAIFVFLFSRLSRKKYKCPECGNTITVEYLEAKRCDVCGALLKEESKK